MLKIIFTLIVALNAAAFSKEQGKEQGDKEYRKLIVTAWKLSSRISPDPQKLNYVFDRSFFNYLSNAKTTAMLKELYEENGSVVEVSTVSLESPTQGNFFFRTDRDLTIPVTITIEEGKGRITGLFFRPSFKKTSSLAEVTSRFEKLAYGKTALLIKKLGGIEDNVYAKNEDQPMAIGSAFKLYVLASMLENGLKWEKVLKIAPENKSLPTGRSQLLPDNSPLTAFSLASVMISESDNTASDVLIDYAGREKVEKTMSGYNSKPELNIPFLKTVEFFKIKYSSAPGKYLSLGSVGEKRKFLEKIKKDKLDLRRLKLGEPVHIDTVEWFASPEELCRLMDYFRKKNDKYANVILSLNPGLDVKTAGFRFAGFKGGGEPGVMSLTWLLQTRTGTWYCVSAAVNDGKELIKDKEMVSVMQDVINRVGNESF